MVRLTPKDELSDEMLHYRDLFAEKYGYGAEVPVLELLDVDHGLGAPAGYSSDVVRRPVPKRAKSSKSVRLDTMLERKIMFAMHQNQNTIEPH